MKGTILNDYQIIRSKCFRFQFVADCNFGSVAQESNRALANRYYEVGLP